METLKRRLPHVVVLRVLSNFFVFMTLGVLVLVVFLPFRFVFTVSEIFLVPVQNKRGKYLFYFHILFIILNTLILLYFRAYFSFFTRSHSIFFFSQRTKTRGKHLSLYPFFISLFSLFDFCFSSSLSSLLSSLPFIIFFPIRLNARGKHSFLYLYFRIS